MADRRIRKIRSQALDLALSGADVLFVCEIPDDRLVKVPCLCLAAWCTVYLLETHPEHRGKGEAQKLLKFLQEKCKQTNRKFRVWYPMNDKVEHICSKLGIEVIRDIDREEVAGQD